MAARAVATTSIHTSCSTSSLDQNHSTIHSPDHYYVSTLIEANHHSSPPLTPIANRRPPLPPADEHLDAVLRIQEPRPLGSDQRCVWSGPQSASPTFLRTDGHGPNANAVHGNSRCHPPGGLLKIEIMPASAAAYGVLRTDQQPDPRSSRLVPSPGRSRCALNIDFSFFHHYYYFGTTAAHHRHPLHLLQVASCPASSTKMYGVRSTP
ncbi:hypothetical protein ASPZODRAFT_731500 [Penicilliopsis zonata CBS 506.65]|uniref:Uncharacterized protein n=1 Tax=Penicilliopsis zonata CBS 506.65 TaxID=1073090 RepID=A0A1L9SC75_9EURO|nr:hypothetical protein ASPZODRAFT_731500 [Penicilliopsis zonata CBS 506.65]OJJ44754.1 hypothetical protein ASPZODRAFT_731500 [Penicilliopsis zonata CBS 506.65]